jgi:hypothetical protein
MSLHIGVQGRVDSPERDADFSGRQFAPGDDPAVATMDVIS